VSHEGTSFLLEGTTEINVLVNGKTVVVKPTNLVTV
jgi:hypothetical protein